MTLPNDLLNTYVQDISGETLTFKQFLDNTISENIISYYSSYGDVGIRQFSCKTKHKKYRLVHTGHGMVLQCY